MTEIDAPLPAAPEPPPPPKPPREKKAWGKPVLRLDIVWTRFETVLCVVVIALEVLALTLWVALKGLSTPSGGDSSAGVVFRAMFGATALGILAWQVTRKRTEKFRVFTALGGVAIGLFTARAWGNVGVDYTSNLLNWYQQASVLTLFGGLRGIGTRLTLLLSILGGSLATARGKHITIDLVQRFASERVRVPVVVVGWVISAFISGVLAWGFFDHISIESFGANPHGTVGEKFAAVGHELGEGFFITRKQLSLDLRSTYHVALKGEPYSEWMTGTEWNEWLDGAGFAERYGAESIQQLKVPPEDLRAPMVIIPGRGEPRGELISAANLVYPFGFLIIAIRFLMRSLLALSGHVSVDPDDSGEFSSDDDELKEPA